MTKVAARRFCMRLGNLGCHPRWVIRLATPSDSPALHALQLRLDNQSRWMLLEPGERDLTDEAVSGRLSRQDASGSFDLVAPSDADSCLSGWLSVTVLPYNRARHVGYLVLGVDQAAAGRGLGGALMRWAIDESTRRSIDRLELTVMTDNLRALSLYLRHGFQIEGIRRGAIRRDGALVDEYYMARLHPWG